MSETGKIAVVILENAVETYEAQTQLANRISVFKPNSAEMQNAGNVMYRTVQQHAPVIEGWDMNGKFTDIIEETCPIMLGEPVNDAVSQRVDDMRDMGYWTRRGVESGRRQVSELNKRIAQLVVDTGSLYYRSNTVSGFDFISEAQTIKNERQSSDDDWTMLLNDRSTQKYSSDLAGRQTLQGRPESEAWAKGQIGSNVAGFDVFTGSFLPKLAGGAITATTTTAALSFKPTGGTVDAASGVVTNTDYRKATIPVVASAAYSVGMKVTIGDLKAVGLADKTVTDQDMTFTIAAIPDSTSVVVYPKPIALDDAALSTLEKAYANVDTTIASGDAVNVVNLDANAQTNIFWAKDSIEVIGGEIPANLLQEFDGKKVITKAMSNGQVMYCVYDGNIVDMTLRYRLFTWYGLANLNPMANGVAVSYS